jgi:hypothetical protein
MISLFGSCNELQRKTSMPNGTVRLTMSDGAALHDSCDTA